MTFEQMVSFFFFFFFKENFHFITFYFATASNDLQVVLVTYL
jgi:hypothetical protein